MGYVVIPIRTTSDLNAAADVNTLMGNDAYLKSELDTIAVTSGSGAPSSTPSRIGNRYIDTTSGNEYFAIGISSSADWILQSQAPKIGMINFGTDLANAWSIDNVGATKYIAYQTGYITTMAILFYTSTNGGKVKGAIYASHTGNDRPDGAPLVVTNEVTLDGVTDQIVLLTFSTPYKITKGTTYWLAFNTGTYNTAPFRLVGAMRSSICQYWPQSYSSGNSFLTISGTGTAELGIQMICY